MKQERVEGFSGSDHSFMVVLGPVASLQVSLAVKTPGLLQLILNFSCFMFLPHVFPDVSSWQRAAQIMSLKTVIGFKKAPDYSSRDPVEDAI